LLREALAASLSLLTVSSTASAATVELRPGQYSEPASPVHVVTFTAAAGEVNMVTARFVGIPGTESGTWRITDASATVIAAAPCTQIDEHNVSCPHAVGSRFEGAAFALGDGDDTLATDSDSIFSESNVIAADGGAGNDRFAIGSNWSVRVFGGAGNDDFSATGRRDDLHSVLMSGGPGDDRLDGSVGTDILNGGGGEDELFGRDGDDRLDDGDRNAADPGRLPGPDVLDGGRGDYDLVTYSRRTAEVSVDLASGAPAGQAGENDVIVGVESVTGGRADDRLAGNRRGNALNGGRGDDRLVGRGGTDHLDPGPGEGLASCGRGRRDDVEDPRRGTLVTGDCETVFFGDEVSFSPYPDRIGRTRVGYDIECPTVDTAGEIPPKPCEGSARLSTASAPNRVLAAAPIPRGPWTYETLDLALPLTATGRRLAGRRRGVLAVVRMNFRDGRGPIDEPSLYAWTIRLKVPNR
jgi:RTX calcium-binding nonapeptide repeat (4 copies)